MSQFKKENLGAFLGVVRKYMQVRGGLTQKDLAEKTESSVSSMSRFLNMKTHELDPALIAQIVAKLEVPLHEVIDFIEESYTDQFKRMVKFYKGEDFTSASASSASGAPKAGFQSGSLEEAVASSLGTAQKETIAKVKIGAGPQRNIPFSADKSTGEAFMEKLRALSPRQKAYIADFLNLDMEGRDLMVDLGNSLFRYFRQKGLEL